LLQEWKRQVKNGGILLYMLTGFFGWNRLSRLERDKSVIYLRLQFDYNKRSFVPVEEPAVINIDQVERFAEDLYRCYASFPPRAANHCKLVVFLTVTGMDIASVMPFTIEQPTSALARSTWMQLVELLDGVTLTSSKFATWPALLQQNLNSSINNSVRTHSQFQPFLVNALRIDSARSRHKTHIVTVDMDMGRGLGEISRLKSYSVKPAAEVTSLLQQAGILTAETRQLLDLKNNPQLLRSRAQFPHNCLMPIFFWCPRTKVNTIIPNLMEVASNHPIHSVKLCDKKAKAAFAKLQKIRFPGVQSPELQ
jgi:hypothetical protein